MDGIERAAPDRRTARFDRASPATRAGVGDGRDAIRFATIAAASARARGPGPDRPARAALPSPRKQTRALRSRSRCEARRRNRSAAPRATFACGTYRRATLARATTGRTAAADMVMADILRESVRAKMGPLARIRPSSPAPDSSRSHEDSPSSVSASLADQRARDWCERSERFSPPIPVSFSAAVFFCTRSRHGRLETEKAPPLYSCETSTPARAPRRRRYRSLSPLSPRTALRINTRASIPSATRSSARATTRARSGCRHNASADAMVRSASRGALTTPTRWRIVFCFSSSSSVSSSEMRLITAFGGSTEKKRVVVASRTSVSMEPPPTTPCAENSARRSAVSNARLASDDASTDAAREDLRDDVEMMCLTSGDV